MSDIYKTAEQTNFAPKKKKRRKRSTSSRNFDEPQKRRRRSSNRGLRRIRHLLKKSENEKGFWLWSLGLLIVFVILAVFAQFAIRNSVDATHSEEASEYGMNVQYTVPSEGESRSALLSTTYERAAGVEDVEVQSSESK